MPLCHVQEACQCEFKIQDFIETILGSSNDSKKTFYNLDTSGHNPTDYYTEARTDVETTTEPLTDASHANVDHESTETLMNNMTNNYYIQDLMMSQGDYATNNFEDNVFDDQY